MAGDIAVQAAAINHNHGFIKRDRAAGSRE
jgi:hypothetical protein